MTEGSIRPANSYIMTLDKDATDYIKGFDVSIELRGTWAKSKDIKQCYEWCESHMGAKYRDWFMIGNTMHFKNGKHATMFRLTWNHLIA